MYRIAGWSLKRIRGTFSRGFKDGAFNGWPGKWSCPAVPSDYCYQDDREAQLFAIHIYTVGFFMGAAEASTGPKVPGQDDAGYHQRIAQASVFSLLTAKSYFEGGSYLEFHEKVSQHVQAL